MDLIHVGIITYRGHERVANLLESIRRREPGVSRSDVGIYVHDDGSPEGIQSCTLEAMRRLQGDHAYCDVGKFPDNRGIAPAWNAATRYGVERGAKYLVLLNDDVLITDRWLEAMVYFLENNPHASGASWGQLFFDPEDVPALLNDPDQVQPRDPVRKPGQRTRDHITRWEPGDARPGRVMAAAGSAFAFTRESWGMADGFPEEFRSFHEEVSMFTSRAQLGRPAYGLTFPLVWHQWSATFGSCPELKASQTMKRSRQLYCEKWGVPAEYAMKPFDWTHPRMMASIPAYPVKWLAASGPREDMDPPCSCVHCETYRAQQRG